MKENQELKLQDLPNLGPSSAKMLERAGITQVEQLKLLGSVRAFGMVRRSGQQPSLNLLWALEGALSGQPWTVVARVYRTSLLLALDQFERE